MPISSDKPRDLDDAKKSILKNMKQESAKSPSTNSRQRVSELNANQQVSRLELVILRTYPRRLVNSPNYCGALAAACG